MGGFRWQVTHFVASTLCTSQGSPLSVVPVVPPPPVPVVAVPEQVPRGYWVAIQAFIAAISVLLARAFGAGGMGAVALCMRMAARWAKVIVGSANEIAVRFA